MGRGQSIGPLVSGINWVNADFIEASCLTDVEFDCHSWFDGDQKYENHAASHRFLEHFGQFPMFDEMTRTGSSTPVLASGELAEVIAVHFLSSADTVDPIGQVSATSPALRIKHKRRQMPKFLYLLNPPFPRATRDTYIIT